MPQWHETISFFDQLGWKWGRCCIFMDVILAFLVLVAIRGSTTILLGTNGCTLGWNADTFTLCFDNLNGNDFASLLVAGWLGLNRCLDVIRRILFLKIQSWSFKGIAIHGNLFFGPQGRWHQLSQPSKGSLDSRWLRRMRRSTIQEGMLRGGMDQGTL